jgi:hypothetical protein
MSSSRPNPPAIELHYRHAIIQIARRHNRGIAPEWTIALKSGFAGCSTDWRRRAIWQRCKAAYTLQTAVTDILAASTRDQGSSVQAPADVGVGNENGNPATTRS